MSILRNLFGEARGKKAKYHLGDIITCKDEGKEKRGIIVCTEPMTVCWNKTVCPNDSVTQCTEEWLNSVHAAVIGNMDDTVETRVFANWAYKKGDYIAYYGFPAKIADVNSGHYKLQFSSQTEWEPGKVCMADGWFAASRVDGNLDVWCLTEEQKFQYFLNVPIM